MSITDRFRGTANRVIEKYGNSGSLHIPTGNFIYDPVTGDSSSVEDIISIRYIITPQGTTTGSDYGLSTFQEGIVTFYVDDSSKVVNETCYISDINGVKWGINTLNTVKVGDIVISYEATMKAHV
jgi:hypothetical protein